MKKRKSNVLGKIIKYLIFLENLVKKNVKVKLKVLV